MTDKQPDPQQLTAAPARRRTVTVTGAWSVYQGSALRALIIERVNQPKL